MFKNYYLFKKQIDEIDPQVRSALISSIYTVHKNELVIDLKFANIEKQLLLCLNPARPYIYLSDFIKYKSNKFNVFDEIYGQEIKSLTITPNNKYLFLTCDFHYISAFFFGQTPNIILYNKEDKFLASFKSLQDGDLPELPEVQNNSSILTNEGIEELLKSDDNIDFRSAAKRIFPAANKRILSELCFRCHAQPEDFVKDYIDVAKRFYAFYLELEYGKACIWSKVNCEPFLLLYNSQLLKEDGYTAEEFSSINKAWKIFNTQSEKVLTKNHLLIQINNALKRRKNVLETALEKLKEAENIEERKTIADLKGNLILTNKHKIPRGAESVDLINIFNELQETLHIKLNPKKTAAENANHYFDKYKNATEKKQILAMKKAIYQKDYNEICQLESKTSHAQAKELYSIRERLINMNLLQDENEKVKNDDSLKFSFKRLILENKWDIYIGKNNFNNELLTFSFAKKSDLWLHAQGVAGSHVVIKSPAGDSSVPKNIIEQAAQIAAANSKARHSTTVPVIYTKVRFISKIRKAPAGTVNVKNEKVIFVKPLNFNQ